MMSARSEEVNISLARSTSRSNRAREVSHVLGLLPILRQEVLVEPLVYGGSTDFRASFSEYRAPSASY